MGLISGKSGHGLTDARGPKLVRVQREEGLVLEETDR